MEIGNPMIGKDPSGLRALMSQLNEQQDALEDMENLSVAFLEKMQHIATTMKPSQRLAAQPGRTRREERQNVDRTAAELNNTTIHQLFLSALINPFMLLITPPLNNKPCRGFYY